MKVSIMMMVTIGKKNFVIFHIIQFEDNKAFGKQVSSFVAIEQIVVLTAFVIGFQHI